jgi:diphthamide synthase (EF-2-diphthine--ammonia ligase)
MKILLSWSSGKDSAWALHLLNQQHPGAVSALLTTVNEAMDRVAMHGVRRSVLQAQARAARLPLHVVHLPHPCPNEVYEAQMRAAIADARANGFTHAAFGDLFLEDIRGIAKRSSRAPGSSRSSLSGGFRPVSSHSR